MRVSDIGTAISARRTRPSTPGRWQAGHLSRHLQAAGRERHRHVDTILKQLPQIKQTLPPGIHISTLSDRTTTIRAAVKDVQFTLLLTIALVVGVIFVFLRNIWATIIPTITVPLALLGACAAMWVAGYTLDNLSLMALTIAVGFVVSMTLSSCSKISRATSRKAKAS